MTFAHRIRLGSKTLTTIAALTTLFAVSALVPAQAATFGRTTVGTTPTGGLTGNFKRGSKFTLSEPGTVTSLHAYADGFGEAGDYGFQWVRMALYKDAGGVPGVKVLETQPLYIYNHAVGGWATFATPAVPLEPADYWIVMLSEPGAKYARLFYDGAANWYGNADNASDGADAPFGAGNSGQGTLSLYATYTPAAQAPHFGRASIATLPSKGLSANAKRGSKFALTENGTLNALYAYLDGFGGATGIPPQNLRMALYRDSNGTPGAKVVESLARDVYTETANWYEFPTPNVALTPGNYWIVIHSGDTAARARDYGDGAANWFGNSDTYSDGASDPFGSGNTGTVTLSVYANYTKP